LPLAHLKNFSSVRKYTQTTNGRSQEQFSAIHAFETKNDLHHRITPTLGEIGAIDALAVEMNDALDNVRQYGITPAPHDDNSLYSPLRRMVSWAMLALFAALVAAATHVLLHERQRLFTPLAYAGAELHPVELTAAQFVPADPKRHDAIMDAIDRDDVAAMRQLLAQGIDPNTEAHHGSSLLHMAVSKETTAMMDALIEGGADINRVVTRGRQIGGTPLSVATYYANAKLMAQLIARGARPRGLVYYGWEYANLAAFSGCIDCLKLLKREGIDLDAFAPDGRRETPIMTAARYGKLDVIRFLASEGASLTKRDQHGYNAMGWAHFFKQDAAKELLLALGADSDTGERKSLASPRDDAKFDR
jgi:ankyrin repeat protein